MSLKCTSPAIWLPETQDKSAFRPLWVVAAGSTMLHHFHNSTRKSSSPPPPPPPPPPSPSLPQWQQQQQQQQQQQPQHLSMQQSVPQQEPRVITASGPPTGPFDQQTAMYDWVLLASGPQTHPAKTTGSRSIASEGNGCAEASKGGCRNLEAGGAHGGSTQGGGGALQKMLTETKKQVLRVLACA